MAGVENLYQLLGHIGHDVLADDLVDDALALRHVRVPDERRHSLVLLFLRIDVSITMIIGRWRYRERAQQHLGACVCVRVYTVSVYKYTRTSIEAKNNTSIRVSMYARYTYDCLRAHARAHTRTHTLEARVARDLLACSRVISFFVTWHKKTKQKCNICKHECISNMQLDKVSAIVNSQSTVTTALVKKEAQL